jgi:hypothetical protein
MANFMRGFSKGLADGQRLGELWNDARMKDELRAANGLKSTSVEQYNPEQAAQLQDEAEKAGGTWDESQQAYKMPDGSIVAPTKTPTYSNGAYHTADGGTVAPAKRFSLGNQTQDTEFTTDQLAEARLGAKADIYSNYGKEDLAEQMRANALDRSVKTQQIKLGNLQYSEAQTKADQAKHVNALLKLKQSEATMSPEEFMGKLVDLTDPMHKDGITNGFEPQEDGTYKVTQMHGNKIIGSKIVTSDEAFHAALKYASPEWYENMTKKEEEKARDKQAQENWKTTRDDGRNDRTQDVNYRNTQAADQKEQQGIDNGMKRALNSAQVSYYNAGASGRLNGASLNDAQQYALDQQKVYDKKVNAIQDRVDKGEITQAQGDKLMTSANRRLGFNPSADKPAKPWTTTDATNVEALLSQSPDWATISEATRQERRAAERAAYTGEPIPKRVSTVDAADGDRKQKDKDKKTTSSKPTGRALFTSDAAYAEAQKAQAEKAKRGLRIRKMIDDDRQDAPQTPYGY